MAAAAHEGSFVQAGVGSVAYIRWPGAGVPILLVHGVGASSGTWGEIPAHLSAAGRDVVALDLLGHGQTGSAGDYGLAANADVLRGLLDHLDVARVHIVGHSFGGGVAMQFAADNPQRVSSLTLISSGGLGREVSPSMRAVLLPGSAPIIRLITHRLLTGPMRLAVRFLAARGIRSRDFNERAVDTLAALQGEGRLAGFIGSLRSVIDLKGQTVTVLDQLEILDPRRLLIVWGEADPMLPVRQARIIHDVLPGSRLVVMAGSGHEPHADVPDAVLEEILQHADDHLPVWSPDSAWENSPMATSSSVVQGG